MFRGFHRNNPVGNRFLAPDGDDRRARSGISEEEEFHRGAMKRTERRSLEKRPV